MNRLAAAAVLLLLAGCEEDPIVQPIPFNHRIHAENALTCDLCHEHYLEGPHAGIPSVEVCVQCHAEDITSNPAAAQWIAEIRKHAADGTEPKWVRLYKLPAHVYYSHRRHAGIAALPCATCHGDIGTSTSPPTRPIERTLRMETCMDCHEKRGVTNDCAWCHR